MTFHCPLGHHMLHRRQLLKTSPLLLGALVAPFAALAQQGPSTASAPATDRLAAAWRTAPGSGQVNAGRDFAGILELDWTQRQVRIAVQVLLPDRVHGLLAEPDGGFLAVATRPGHFLMRMDAQGQVVVHHTLDQESPQRTLDGHVSPSADGQWLYTSETDRSTGQGWISVRDRTTLRKVDQWPSHGMDPHQCLLDASGALMLANGGIPRNADGGKRELHRMAPSLVRLDGKSGELLGQWRLLDPRLSIRHLAWSLGGASDAPRLLGVGLQAEHDLAQARNEAPTLAVWDGKSLRLPTRSALAGGYAGDIAPGPGGGFIVSGQKVNRGLLWHPDDPGQLHTIAELRELCALAAWQGKAGASGVLIGSVRGVSRWHPSVPGAMLAWPQDMSPDNHWVVLG